MSDLPYPSRHGSSLYDKSIAQVREGLRDFAKASVDREALSLLADYVKALERERDAWRSSDLSARTYEQRLGLGVIAAGNRAYRAEAEVVRLREALLKCRQHGQTGGSIQQIVDAALSEEPRA